MTRQYNLPLPRSEAMSAADFMVSESNREALAWIMERSPETWPSHCLVLRGGSGCGKTHLLNMWAEGNGAKKAALGEDAITPIMDKKTGFSCIAIDDAEGISGDPELEEWLQHLYNAAKEKGAHLLLAAKTPPAVWGITLKDIESRLKSCPVVEIQEPDDALVRGMLLKQFSDRQLLVDKSVIEYLAGRLERTGAAIRSAVDLIDRKSLERGSKITIPFLQQAMEETADLFFACHRGD